MIETVDRRAFLIGAGAAAMLPLSARAEELGDGAHAFSFESIDGGTLDLAAYAGRPVLVVNTASQCGFTPQYDGLQALYDRYKDRGFVVLAVPSDDFGGQEYATEAEVKDFCEVNFNLTFPMTNITKVRGSAAHPFYHWAADILGSRNAPSWNFHKYLIGPHGEALGAFRHTTKPMSKTVTSAVEAALSL